MKVRCLIIFTNIFNFFFSGADTVSTCSSSGSCVANLSNDVLMEGGESDDYPDQEDASQYVYLISWVNVKF